MTRPVTRPMGRAFKPRFGGAFFMAVHHASVKIRATG